MADTRTTSGRGPASGGSVLVVDDDPGVLSLLRRALVLAGYEVLVAESGEAALNLAATQEPVLVVLDVMLPGIDGFTVAQRLRAAGSTPILMLTAKDTVPDRVTGLDSGADDYLVKPFSVEELLARVRALLRRSHAEADGDVLTFEDLQVDVKGRRAYRGSRLLDLTPREFNLLLTLARHPRQALSREQLSQMVWGYAFQGESNFVDAAVKDLRRKMEEAGEARLVQTVRGHGYALRED
ncbi:MAG TPA: response regulator transcription factor [Chloroflexota bacterium]|nr:response regulator transcription factor [Chloroflexota bacterium]